MMRLLCVVAGQVTGDSGYAADCIFLLMPAVPARMVSVANLISHGSGTRSIQVFPGGQCFEVLGAGESLSIVERAPSGTATTRRPTKEERRAIDVQECAERLLQSDVLACQSSLVDALMRSDFAGFAVDDIVNLFPDASSWDVDDCRAWFDEHGIETPEEVDGVETYRNLVRDNAEPAEVFEWWLVTDWMAKKLRDAGNVVLENEYGAWWGRTCTGQQLLMDGTLQDVAGRLLDSN